MLHIAHQLFQPSFKVLKVLKKIHSHAENSCFFHLLSLFVRVHFFARVQDTAHEKFHADSVRYMSKSRRQWKVFFVTETRIRIRTQFANVHQICKCAAPPDLLETGRTDRGTH